MNGPLTCVVQRSGGHYLIQFCNEKGVFLQCQSNKNFLEHAEQEALQMFPEAEYVNGMRRSENIMFPIPETGVPIEKGSKQKRKPDDGGLASAS